MTKENGRNDRKEMKGSRNDKVGRRILSAFGLVTLECEGLPSLWIYGTLVPLLFPRLWKAAASRCTAYPYRLSALRGLSGRTLVIS